MQTHPGTSTGATNESDAPMCFDSETTQQTQAIYRAHQQSGELSPAFNRTILVTLSGALHVDRFTQALRETYQQHECLRSSLQAGGKHWLVAIDYQPDFQFIKGTPDNTEETENQLIDLVDQSMQRAFDLHDESLFRSTLIQVSADSYVLLLSCHLCIGDTDMLGIIAHTLADRYQLSGNHPSQVTPVPPSTLSAPQKTDRNDIQWWLEQPGSGALSSEMPTGTDFASDVGKATRVDLPISPGARQSVLDLAADHQCSIYEVLLSALAILIKRLDPAQIIAIQCREPLRAPQLQPVMVPMAVAFEVDLNLTGAEVLQAVVTNLAQAREHPIYDGQELLRSANVDSISTSISFGLVDTLARDHLMFDQTQGQAMTISQSLATIPFDLTVVDDGHSLHLECLYRTDCFDEQSIVNWIGAYRALVVALARESRLPTGVLDILDPRHESLIAEFSGTSNTEPVDDTSIAHRVDHLALTQGQRVAVEAQGGRLSFEQCESLSNQIARGLLDNGIAKGQCVALRLPDPIQEFATRLACLKAGIQFVSLPTHLATSTQANIAMQSQSRALVSVGKRPKEPEWQELKTIMLDRNHDQIATQSSAPLLSESVIDPSATAWFDLRTVNGTLPTCVPVTWAALTNLITNSLDILGLESDDRVVFVRPDGQGCDFTLALVAMIRGCHVILPSMEISTNYPAMQRMCENADATALVAPAPVWQGFVQFMSTGLPLKIIVNSLGLQHETVEKLLGSSPSVRRVLGTIESGYLNIAGSISSSEHADILGRPQADTSIRIVDDRAQPCPIGSIGEILIGGPSLSRGYVDAALLTSQQFVRDVFAENPELKLFRSGMRGAWTSNGQIQVDGSNYDNA